jgi:DNA-binding CsgD family transcriptional regulator
MMMRLWRSSCGWEEPHLAVAAARERLGCRHHVARGSHLLGRGRSVTFSAWLMGELAAVEVLVGDLDEAGLHLGELIYNAGLLDDAPMLATGLAHRSLLELLDGSFQTAASTALSSLDFTNEAGIQDLPYIALAHVVAGWGALHELDLRACEEHLASAESHGAPEMDLVVSELLRLLRARLLAEQGRIEEASRLLAQHRSVDRAVPVFLRRLAAIVEAQTAALVNDVATVRERAQTLSDLGYPAESDLFDAVADAGEGSTDEALARIESLVGRPRLDAPTAAVAAVVRVALLLRRGELERAAERMPDLMTRVAPQRLLQILTVGFLGGEAFTELLVGEARSAHGHPFALEALARLGRHVARPGPHSPRIQAVSEALKAVAAEVAPDSGEGLIDLLTPREREVLVELSYGGSYGDVARALFVSENTVKTHLSSVYRKLGVDRRGDALRIAREHHLV